MDYIDANYILRYLLKDVEEQYLKAVNVIENENLFVPDFIVAEVVYVLEKVYSVDRNTICTNLSNLFKYGNISFYHKESILHSLIIYNTDKIDYSDALLIAYYFSDKQSKVYTFDKQIERIVNR